MSTVSPPKPWERARAGASGASSALTSSTGNASQTTTTTSSTPSSSSTTSTAPAVPQRPSSLNSVVNRTASTYSNPTVNRPYGGYGSNYGYSSPFSRFGGGGYGYGGMGAPYGGGYGGMYGGSGMYGNGMAGQQPDPNDPNSMTHNFAQSTAATFQIIESIVGAFGGFAQMLESTYMATHSSFFAMVNVAEQFGNLRQTLGSVLGIYTLLRWLRTLVAKLTGRPPPADATALTPSAFAAFASGDKSASNTITGPDGRPVPRPSKKPFIVFLLAVFGLPYLMGKLIRAIAHSQEQAAAANQQDQQRPDPLDPSKLDFCRVLYDFPPQEAVAQGSFNKDIDLSVKKGDLVAVLDKSSPDGNDGAAESSWWRCRARDGRMGYLPAVFLETIQRRPKQIADAAASSRANSMPGTLGQGGDGVESASDSRAQTMPGGSSVGHESSKVKKEDANGVPTEGLEKFQKAWVNDR